MLLESRPNIVVDDNYKMFVKEMKRRYAERGASVYINNEAIEQERRDAHARNMAPEAYRFSAATGDAVGNYRREATYMTTEDYLRYFGKCHDAFEAVNYYNLHKEKENVGTAEPKILVNRRMVARIRREESASVKVKETRHESFSEKISAIFAGMSRARRRAVTGMAAAALSLVLMIGGVVVLVQPGSDADYVKQDAQPQVMDVAEVGQNENLVRG